jgi:hypothetical protein
MLAIALARPLHKPRVLPKRKDFDLTTAPEVKIAGAAVILGVLVFFIAFW